MSPQATAGHDSPQVEPSVVNEVPQTRAKLQHHHKRRHQPCSPNPRLMGSWSTPESKADYARRGFDRLNRAREALTEQSSNLLAPFLLEKSLLTRPRRVLVAVLNSIKKGQYPFCTLANNACQLLKSFRPKWIKMQDLRVVEDKEPRKRERSSTDF